MIKSIGLNEWIEYTSKCSRGSVNEIFENYKGNILPLSEHLKIASSLKMNRTKLRRVPKMKLMMLKRKILKISMKTRLPVHQIILISQMFKRMSILVLEQQQGKRKLRSQ